MPVIPFRTPDRTLLGKVVITHPPFTSRIPTVNQINLIIVRFSLCSLTNNFNLNPNLLSWLTKLSLILMKWNVALKGFITLILPPDNACIPRKSDFKCLIFHIGWNVTCMKYPTILIIRPVTVIKNYSKIGYLGYDPKLHLMIRLSSRDLGNIDCSFKIISPRFILLKLNPRWGSRILVTANITWFSYFKHVIYLVEAQLSS